MPSESDAVIAARAKRAEDLYDQESEKYFLQRPEYAELFQDYKSIRERIRVSEWWRNAKRTTDGDIKEVKLRKKLLLLAGYRALAKHVSGEPYAGVLQELISAPARTAVAREVVSELRGGPLVAKSEVPDFESLPFDAFADFLKEQQAQVEIAVASSRGKTTNPYLTGQGLEEFAELTVLARFYWHFFASKLPEDITRHRDDYMKATGVLDNRLRRPH